MKKATKIILITALVLILGGFALSIGTLAIAGLPFGEEYHAYRTEHDAALSIRTDLNSASLYIRQTDGDKIVVTCNDVENDRRITVTERNGVLEITYEAEPWYRDVRSWVSFGVSPKYDVEIAIPKVYDTAKKITIEAKSGRVEVEEVALPSADFNVTSGFVEFDEVTCAGALSISTASGMIVLDKVRTAGALSIRATSGSIHLSDIKCGGDLSIDGTSGSLRLETIWVGGSLMAGRTSGTITGEAITCKGDLLLQTNSGAIHVDDASAASLQARATSGSLKFEDLMANDIHLETTSGAIRATIKGKMSDYTITSSTTSGSNNLPEYQTGAEKTLVAKATSGSIKVKFGTFKVKS